MAQHQSQLPCPAPRRRSSAIRAATWLTTIITASTALAGCSAVGSLHHYLFGPTQKISSPNSGTVVADEPQAALVGRDVLARGGNAADAATATAFALSVTLPSRASLGGGGACLISRPRKAPQMVSFLARKGSGTGERPASIPMMARGLYLLQTQYGRVEFNDTLDPAINLARDGMSISQALANDLSVVGSSLLSNEEALSVFGRNGTNESVQLGDRITQIRLTSFLSRLKLVGIGDLYNGSLSEVFTNQANKAGAGLVKEDLRRALPVQEAALHISTGQYKTSLLALPNDSGIGIASSYKNGLTAQSAVSAWRQSGLSNTLNSAQSFIDNPPKTSSQLSPLPASTSFVVSDQSGMAVSCALSENNLFGTGRIASSTGVILGAAPSSYYPNPLLSSAIVQEKNGALRAVLSASGQNDAADAIAQALRQISEHKSITSSPGTGRLNSITCNRSPKSCQGSTDPQGHGISVQTVAH